MRIPQIKHKKTAIGIAVGAIALAGLGTGVAHAAIPDSSGVIHGCYKPTSDGHNAPLGVIDTALSNGSCPAGDTTVTWNQVGPQGPAGATGTAGATGATGPAGPAGISNYQLIQQSEPSGCSGGTFYLSIPSGTQVIGAGVDNPGGPDGYLTALNGPDPSDSTKWEFNVNNGIPFQGCGPSVTMNLWMTVATVSS